ncbi:MAG: hypothetical protein WB660_03540 [Candidatus Sulfotelmatobacter sp.]
MSGLSIFGFVAPSDGIAKAKGLALRALELEPGLAEAHTSVAWVKTWYDFDFVVAEREFERSIELNSRHPMAHGWFGYFLGLMGRYEEGYTECQRALRLDPLSTVMQFYLGQIYWMAHRYDQLIERSHKTLKFDDRFIWTQGMLAWGYLGKSMHQEAIACLREGIRASPSSTLYLAALAEAHAAAGEQLEARRTLEQLNGISKQRYVTPYMFARVYAALSETNEALKWLEAAYQERASFLAFLKVDPHFENLRSEPRFQTLMQRMNFP